MKHFRLPVAILVASATLFALAESTSAHQDEPRRCTVATLKGGFGYTVNGALTGGPAPGPFVAVGRLLFDGSGNFENVRTISRNGVIARNARGIGTYTVEPDCSGTLTFTDGGVVTLSTDLVIDSNGDEFRMIATSPGTVLAVTGRKQFTSSGKR